MLWKFDDNAFPQANAPPLSEISHIPMGGYRRRPKLLNSVRQISKVMNNGRLDRIFKTNEEVNTSC